MVSFYVMAAIGTLIVFGIGKLVADALLKPKGAQLASGESPQRPAAVGGGAASSSSTHRVVSLKAGAPLAVQMREHANAAEDMGLRPFLEFGAQWCPPSRMFGEVLGDPRMVAALRGVYLMRVELDDFGGDPRAKELGVTAVPVFFELDAEGQPTGRRIDGGAWGADTIDNMSRTMTPFFAA